MREYMTVFMTIEFKALKKLADLADKKELATVHAASKLDFIETEAKELVEQALNYMKDGVPIQLKFTNLERRQPTSS